MNNMGGDNVLGSGTVPPAATTAGALIGAAIAITPAIVKKASEVWDRYGKKAQKQITKLQNAYIEFCYPAEKDSSITILEKKQPSDKGGNNHQLPEYFQMDPEGKFPLVFFKRGFKPEKNLSVWLRRLAVNNLRQYVEEMLGYIIEYQAYRDDVLTISKIFTSESSYDPTNLFFEEFKSWLVELSKASPIDEKTLIIVKARINYLSNILNNNIFDINENVKTTSLQAILHINQILQFGIVPFIELEISRTCSRDYFKSLKIDLEMTIRSGLAFLLYGYRDNDVLPHAFIIGEIRNPSLPGYLSVTSTISGQLLQLCVNSGPMKLVCRKLEIDKYQLSPSQTDLAKTNQTSLDIFENKFFDNADQVSFPLEDRKLDITIANWYEKNSSGVAKQFRRPELMQQFLKLHGQIQKIAMFVVIADIFYDLAGVGGDILVYGAAKEQIEKALEHSEKLLKSATETIQFLFHHSKEYRNSMINHTVPENQKWLNIFNVIEESFGQFHVKSDECLKTLAKINSDKAKINSKEYAAWVNRKLDLLSNCVNQFVENPAVQSSVQERRLTNDTPKLLMGNSSGFFHKPSGSDSSLKPPVVNQLLSLDPQTLYNEAINDLSQGKFDTALLRLQKMINDLGYINDVDVRLARAAIYIGLEQYENALIDIKFAFDKDMSKGQAFELHTKLNNECVNSIARWIRERNFDTAERYIEFLKLNGNADSKARAAELQTSIDNIRREVDRQQKAKAY